MKKKWPSTRCFGGLEQISISSVPQRQGRPVGIRWDPGSDDEEVHCSKVEAHGDVGEPTKKVVAEKPAVEASPTSGVAKPAFNFGMSAPARPPPPAYVEDEPVVLLPEESSEPIEAVIPPED
ncbi:hypothetical protein Fcan01_21745 [Folsomia candida]|uniref:Uncharacterized protein n=1 Tax=Folsomia candida TaxID=158441 RepID=A0A226DE56_FOLCA|nr:hypothetical protein Fcan01_21745 [Folsomia candida]